MSQEVVVAYEGSETYAFGYQPSRRRRRTPLVCTPSTPRSDGSMLGRATIFGEACLDI